MVEDRAHCGTPRNLDPSTVFVDNNPSSDILPSTSQLLEG
jgi:hypothetical protein